MKTKLMILLAVIVATFVTSISVIRAAEPIVTINGLTTYETFDAALAVAVSGDSIELIANVILESDLTIPAGIELKIEVNTLTVPVGFNLTILGELNIGALGGNIVNDGTITLESTSVSTIDGTITNNKFISFVADSIMHINGNLDCTTNSRLLSDTNDGAIININRLGAITGNSTIFDAATQIVFNNYGGQLSPTIVAVLPVGYYFYYPIYNETTLEYFQTFDELVTGDSVNVISNITINGDSTIPSGVIVNVESNKIIRVNGTFTVNGSLYLTNVYSPVVANNLYGTGTIYLNSATEMAASYWTYVNILDDVSITLIFEAKDGYNPAADDVLFELGQNEDDAIRLAAKINLGESFSDFVVNPKESSIGTQHGFALGVLGNSVVEKIVDATNPPTGNANIFIIGILSIIALMFAGFFARKIYKLNRI